jgi:hypothetical protein
MTFAQGRTVAGQVLVRLPGSGTLVALSNQQVPFGCVVDATHGTVSITTEDLCEGTLIRVARDRVKVTDLVRHRTVVVRAQLPCQGALGPRTAAHPRANRRVPPDTSSRGYALAAGASFSWP